MTITLAGLSPPRVAATLRVLPPANSSHVAAATTFRASVRYVVKVSGEKDIAFGWHRAPRPGAGPPVGWRAGTVVTRRRHWQWSRACGGSCRRKEDDGIRAEEGGPRWRARRALEGLPAVRTGQEGGRGPLHRRGRGALRLRDERVRARAGREERLQLQGAAHAAVQDAVLLHGGRGPRGRRPGRARHPGPGGGRPPRHRVPARVRPSRRQAARPDVSGQRPHGHVLRAHTRPRALRAHRLHAELRELLLRGHGSKRCAGGLALLARDL